MKLNIYKCLKCGQIIEILNEGPGTLVCCKQKMKLQSPKTSDSSTEKHIPYIKSIENGYKVKIGENQKHPMTNEHYIQWIELITENFILRKNLKPDDEPETIFNNLGNEKIITVREYCNLHGHWENILKS